MGDHARSDKKIWRVSYFRIARQPSAAEEPADDLAALKQEMVRCLENIRDFSRSQNLDWFTKAFESALAKLDSPSPMDATYARDIAPPDFLPLAALQLFAAADTAWVFGGMGSWNDQGFPGEIGIRYERVSEDLYAILNRAVVAVANSSIRRSD